MSTEQTRAPRHPRIGSGRALEEMEREAERNVEDLKPSDAERALGTYDAIVAHREVERASLLARVSGVPTVPATPLLAVEVAPGTTAADIISNLATAARTSDAAATAERHAALNAEARPLVSEARSLATRHGMLRSKHLARVSAVALADWNAVRAATPKNLTMVGDRMVSPPHDAIWRLSQAARAAYDPLTSTFGDSATSGRDVDPVNMAEVAAAVEQFLDSGELFDNASGVVLPVFRRALSHLRWWIQKSAAIVAAAEEGITRFDAAAKHFEEVMAKVTPVDGVVLPKPGEIFRAAPAREYKQTFAEDFEPRSMMREEARS